MPVLLKHLLKVFGIKAEVRDNLHEKRFTYEILLAEKIAERFFRYVTWQNRIHVDITIIRVPITLYEIIIES